MPPSTEPVDAFVGLGANLGDAAATLVRAIGELAELPDCRMVARSSLYRSAPVEAGGPDFVNAVVQLSTCLAPAELLAQLQRIEARHGRLRSYRNAPRTLDLDLLLHGDAPMHTPTLTLPHPRLHERAFVLAPLAEIAPALVVPGHGPVADLLVHAAGQRIERLAP
jgi:2-amino-4-hydroxy-6-hydroxymethyldihydropteridine diphosphokinase